MKRILFLFLICSSSLLGQICDPNSNSLLFDGVSSHVNFAANTDLNISDEITIEAWIYPTAFGPTPASGSIVCKHGWTQGEQGYVLRAGGNGQLSFNISGVRTNGNHEGWVEVLSSTGALHLNTWTHVAGTYDGSKLRIYINGNLEESETFHGSIFPSVDYNLKIGRIADEGAASGRYWSGLIDEVRIWDEARSQSEISSNMDHHINAQTASNLVGYWQFNDGSGTSINDRVSGNASGTLAGATWNTDVPFTNGVARPNITNVGGNLVSSSLIGNQWNLNGIPIPGATGITFNPTTGGIYSVTVDLGLGCSAVSLPYVITITGINDMSGNDDISYTVSEKVLTFISFPEKIRKSKLSIYDISGRSLVTDENFQDRINLEDFSTGVYILLMQSDNACYKSKILIN